MNKAVENHRFSRPTMATDIESTPMINKRGIASPYASNSHRENGVGYCAKTSLNLPSASSISSTARRSGSRDPRSLASMWNQAFALPDIIETATPPLLGGMASSKFPEVTTYFFSFQLQEAPYGFYTFDLLDICYRAVPRSLCFSQKPGAQHSPCVTVTSILK